MREAYKDPKVRAAMEAREQRRARERAMGDRARAEGREVGLKEVGLDPNVLAEEHAKLVMAGWENENPANYLDVSISVIS